MLALAAKVRDGNLAAIDRWLRLSESRRRLFGLDAPKELHLVDEEDDELHRLRAVVRMMVEERPSDAGVHSSG